MSVRRQTRRILGLVVVSAATIASFAVAPSLASWTRTDYDNGPVGSLNCATQGVVNTQASGQLINGEIAGTPLTGNLVAVAPLVATNSAPATASTPSGATPATSIGGNAWTSALSVQALSGIHITPSVVLPLNSSLAVGTQYARATSDGIATGASGAVTGAGDGTVSFQTTSPTVPVLPSTGTIDLGTALTSVVGAQLSSDITQLSDASVTVGALGSITDEENGCQNLWQGVQNSAASVVRNYLLAGLHLNLTSSLVGKTTTAVGGTITTLGTTLNALEPGGSLVNTATVDPVTGKSLTGALGSLLNVTLLPGVGVGISGVPTVKAGVTFNLASVASLLTGTIGSGAVTINLGTGTVSVDLAALLGKTDLNGLAPNSSLLTSANVTSIVNGIVSTIATLIGTTVKNAVTALIASATVDVLIDSDVGATVLGLTADVLHAHVELNGSLASFLDSVHNAPPTVTTTVTVLPGASLGLLDLTTLIQPLTNLLTTGVLGSTLPLLDDLVLTPLSTNATAALNTALTTLDGTPITTIDTAFATVLGVLQTAVRVTVNAQPEQTGGVGTPDGSSIPGQFFDSALVVSVLNVGNTAVLGLYLGSSSAGPVSVR